MAVRFVHKRYIDRYTPTSPSDGTINIKKTEEVKSGEDVLHAKQNTEKKGTMRKILVFYWYVPKKAWHPIYALHIKNLVLYADRFDEMVFAISSDEGSEDAVKDLELSLKYAFPKAKFMFCKNDPQARESAFFFKEIYGKLGEFDSNIAIFFGHNKGVDSTYIPDRERCYWINSMYFFNLMDIEKINEALSNENTCSIGVGKITNWRPTVFKNLCKYKWHYTGTFFWIVPSRIKKYIEENNVPELTDISRYSTEAFLGDIFPNNDGHCISIYKDKSRVEKWPDYTKRICDSEMFEEYKSIYGE